MDFWFILGATGKTCTKSDFTLLFPVNSLSIYVNNEEQTPPMEVLVLFDP